MGKDNVGIGDFWLCSLCMEDGKTALYAALYATPQGATSAAMTHLRRTHELETGAVDSEIGTAATDALEPRPRRQKTLHDHLRKTSMPLLPVDDPLDGGGDIKRPYLS
jgi:hypothetical protein